ncbi:MAG: 3-hydroxyacyl-CoA dehydrogenase family protein [candidate division Zixibacteria bacterium]|nr:3-hydroxyacyl-CoA dehydrogenase family protein [candidate division Zixibacteria bacterium]
MTLDERLRNVSVIGAAGKMGSGIALLLAQEMARLKNLPENKNSVFRLHCIDISEQALDGLQSYLKAQLVKAGEKTTVMLRELYRDREDLVENYDIIDAFVDDAMSVIRLGTDLAEVKDSKIIFEAIVEDKDVKVNVLKKTEQLVSPDTYYFTNTSSIPISVLNGEANLSGRIIGYHFYNPPAVQRLLELISPEGTKPELKEMAQELAKRLRKKIVPANDIAGFIGNGHFLRDGLYATREAKKLGPEFGLAGGLYIMNKVSQDLLVRPMGIFQLIDYVGVDVYRCISETVATYIKGEDLQDDLLVQMTEKKVLGGQYADGSQKDGFLKYEKNRPTGVYDPEKGEYKIFDPNGWSGELDKKIGAYPEGHAPWRSLLMDPKRGDKLSVYFKNLSATDTLGAKLARSYLKRSKEIGEFLVKTGVAQSEQDVNHVLLNGFYHLYGPINDYV